MMALHEKPQITKINTIHPKRERNAFIVNFVRIFLSRHFTRKSQPHDGARGNVPMTTKLAVFILWGL